ncbi:MAG TPA: hypothetical protein VFV34_24575 [Blastocatellia bacterium]|nr:hypothetical protein [Blastocatellia bacterium]
MPQEYFRERLRAQEEEIASLRSDFETASLRGNNGQMEDLARKIELAKRLRDSYERMLSREPEADQVLV